MSKILFNFLGYFFRTQAYKALRVGNLIGAESGFSKALYWFDKTKNFTPSFDCQIQLGNIYKVSYLIDLAKEMFESALNLAKQQQNEQSEAIAITNLGMLEALQANHKSAEELYLKASQLTENYPEIQAFVYQNYGVLEQQQQNYLKAEELFNKTIDIYDSIDLIPPQSVTYTDLGEVYIAMGEEKKALEAWRKALVVYDMDNNEAGKADILLYRGQLLEDITEIQSALNINTRLGRELPYANCCTALALLLLENNKFEDAEELLHEAIEIESRLNLSGALIRDYANLAILHQKQENQELFILYLEKAMEIARENKDDEILQDLENLYNKTM